MTTRADSHVHIGVNGLFLDPEGAGGIWTYLHQLMREMPALDPAVEYALFTNRENAGAFDLGGATNVRRIPCAVSGSPALARRAVRLPYEYGVLPLRARRQGVNVLFSPFLTGPLRLGIPAVLTIHDVIHEDWLPTSRSPKDYAFRAMFRAAARGAAHLLTVSAHAKGRIVARYGVPPERVTVVPNAADARFFAPVPPDAIARVRATYGLRGPYVLAVGQVSPHKNLDVLIDAYAALRRAGDTTHQLALVGSPKWAATAVARRVNAEGLAGEAVLTGWVPDADLPALYAGAAVYVLPSRYEGFGIPVLEAMAVGTPVITTTATALPEVAGDAALLFAPDDRVALVAALRRVLTDAALRASLVARGRVRAGQFTWEATARRTLAVLRQVAVSGGATS